MQSASSEATPGSTKKRRRNRQSKACLPCRTRKVRCDLKKPCETCYKRDHVELCVYESEGAVRASKVRGASQSQTSTSSEQLHQLARPSYSVRTLGRTEEDQCQSTNAQIPAIGVTGQDHDQELLELLDILAENLTDSRATEYSTGEVTFLGRNAQATLFRNNLTRSETTVLPPEISIESAFGLTNRTSLHPFGSWNATASQTLAELLQALPKGETCMRYYRVYQQIVHPFYPFVLHPTEFERSLYDVIQHLAASDHSSLSVQELPRDDAAWYGLLFAVLASGCQFSDTDVSSRVLTTRVFVASAYECLRLANLYVLPTLEVAQTMLILEHTIANDCNPGVGWGLLALTARQAQGLGLHLTSQSSTSHDPFDKSLHPIWEAIIQLDSTLSASYDRMPVSFIPKGFDCIQRLQMDFIEPSFSRLMHTIDCLRLQLQAEGPKSEMISVMFVKMDEINNFARGKFHALGPATTIQERLEEHVYKIKSNHFRGEMFRFCSLSKQKTREERLFSFGSMVAAFQAVVESYLKVKQLSPIANSWDILYCAFSSALLLGSFGCLHRYSLAHANVRNVLSSFLTAMSATVDPTDLTMSPYRHGLDALNSILQRFRS